MSGAGFHSLGYVGVGSVRAGEWDAFGPEVLGTPVEHAGLGGVRWLRLDERAYRLAIHPAERDSLLYLGWEVEGPDALSHAADRLGRAGVEVVEESAPLQRERGVQGLLSFHDPFGTRHEVFHGQRELGSFRPTLPMSGFVTGDLGLGHAVLVVPDLEQGLEFFVARLGFGLSDRIDAPPSAFLHCNRRHHSLALAEMSPLLGLHHVMFETRAMEDVGTAYDRVRERSIPLAMELGCHSNDRMFSFYVRTPGGFELEYGWGGRQIDSDWTIQRYAGTSVWGHRPVADSPPTTLHPTR